MKDYESSTEEELRERLSAMCLSWQEERAEKLGTWQKYKCEACEQELNGDKQWKEHLATRKHKNAKHRECKA
jgi:hypothetical protein